MKKHLSVLMLITRSTIYKVLGIMILMCGVEYGLFTMMISVLNRKGSINLEFTIEQARINIVFFAALMAIFFVLSSMGKSKKAKCSYTLNRLQISENWIFFWQALYNTMCFALLLAVQIIAAIFLCRCYAENSGDSTITHQSVFLAFYRDTFLHSLVPFDEPYSIAGTLAAVLCFGLTSAIVPLAERYGKINTPAVFPAAWIAVYTFRRETGSFSINLLIFIMTAFCLGYTVYFLISKEVHYDK